MVNGRFVYIARFHWFTTSQWVLETRHRKGKDCWIIFTAYGKTEYHKPNIMGSIPMYLLSKMSLTKINICKYNT